MCVSYAQKGQTIIKGMHWNVKQLQEQHLLQEFTI